MRNSFSLVRKSFSRVRNSFSLVRNSFCLVRNSFSLVRNSFSLVRKSKSLVRNSFSLVRKSKRLGPNASGSRLSRPNPPDKQRNSAEKGWETAYLAGAFFFSGTTLFFSVPSPLGVTEGSAEGSGCGLVGWKTASACFKASCSVSGRSARAVTCAAS